MTMPAPDITVADVRTYVRWPDSVPDGFLAQHLSGAGRDVAAAVFGVVGGADVPAGAEEDWAEAVKALAAASAYPHVHAFTLDGAASAFRSAQAAANKPHFEDGAAVARAVERLRRRAQTLIERIKAATSAAQPGEAVAISAGGLFMAAL